LYANVQTTNTGEPGDLLVYKYGQRPAEVVMKTRNKERYKELNEHAEVEDDSQKLRKIAKEINRILKAEINRLEKGPKSL
jgi:hypothetical protein